MIGTKEREKQKGDTTPAVKSRNSTPEFSHNSCGGCNACHQMTRVHSAPSSPTWDGSGDAGQRPCAANFFQRHLGNSYIQSVAGGQPSLGGAPTIQRKCACGGTHSPDGECAECRKKRLAAQLRTIKQDELNQMRSDSNASGQQITAALQATVDPRFAHHFSEMEAETGPQKGTSFDKSKSFVVQRQEESEMEDDELGQQEGVVIIEDEEDAVQLQATKIDRYVSLQLNRPQANSYSYSVSEDLSQKILQSRGQGQPLDPNIRTSLESYFQEDFSSVRLHNDIRADYFSKNLNAQAFTVGDNVYFQQGYYNPTSQVGVQLLVHEIAHVRQQRHGVKLASKLPGGKLATGQPGDAYEQEASRVAQEFVRTRNQEAGAGPKIGERRPPVVQSEQILPTAGAHLNIQRQDGNAQCQGGPLEAAGTAVGIAETAVGAVRTVSHGNYDLTRPDRIDAIAPKLPGCDPALLRVPDWRWTFFKFREANPITDFEQVNIHLMATWQTNGCDVRAFHVVSPAGHRRSRWMRDTKAEIFARVSARLVPSTVVSGTTGRTITTGRPCCDYAAELMIPYEVTVDRPWPHSNKEVDGRLYIDGTGESRKEETARWT